MKTKIMIVDYPTTDEAIEFLSKLDLILVFTNEMTKKILAWEKWKTFDPQKTLIIFPGNGAMIVENCLPKNWLENWPLVEHTSTNRFWEKGMNPLAIGGSLHRGYIGIKQVVVIDDVISSGITIQKIRHLNEPWIPGAQWYAVTWVKQESACVKGFVETFTAESVGTKQRKIPINSLSTLVQDEKIANSYIKNNFCSEPIFFEVLQKLRNDNSNQQSDS